MQTFSRICIKEYEISAKNGDRFTAVRGKEYLTSAEHEDGTVTVFSNYWVRVPVENFAGEQQFTAA